MLSKRKPGLGFRIQLLLLFPLVCLLASGCLLNETTNPTKDSKTNPLGGPLPAIPAELKQFYQQSLNWGECNPSPTNETECAVIKAPLDYAHPDGPQIEIWLGRLKAESDQPLGDLFLNPGGPGGSGIEFLKNAPELISSSVQHHYNLIGFDPRGVGRSTPIKCNTDREIDQERAQVTLLSDRHQIDREVAKTKAESKRCQQRSGELIKHVDTVSAARDLDIMRAVTKQPKLAYLGFSYGSYLGTTYASLFPKNVGRMVLDGIVSPNFNYSEVTYLQATGFENAYRNFAKWCVESGGDCPFNSPAAGQQELYQLMDSITQKPLPSGNPSRPLTRSLAEEAIVGLLYSERTYNQLKSALSAALIEQNGAELLDYADQFADRQANGKYENNSHDALAVINYSDYAPTGSPKEWDKTAQKLIKDAPWLGKTMAYGEYVLKAWPFTAKTPRQLKPLRGLVPILLVGNTHDPATPYVMAQDVHRKIDRSVLVTAESYGHIAYGALNSACVDQTVDRYLLEGQPPEKDLHCKE